MTPLRFRAWHEATPEVEAHMDYNPKVVQSVVTIYEAQRDMRTGNIKNAASFRLNDAFIPQVGSTLMQSTGLTDKNGKEIFEGDILRSRDLFKSKEEYAKNPYKFTMVEWNQRHMRWDGCFGDEIIGNIYENPDIISSSVA